MEKSIKHILVIRSSAMGDVAISVPVISAFCQQYPQVKITILTKGIYKPMFSHIKNVSVFPIDTKGRHRGVVGVVRLFYELGAFEFDAVADLHNVLRTNLLKVMFLTKKIPFVQIDKARREKKELTRQKNKIFRQLKPTYQRYADVFEKLGYKINMEKEYFAEKRELRDGIRRMMVEGKKKIGIAPFAAHLGKQYPFEKMKEVIEILRKKENLEIFVFGGGQREKELVGQLQCVGNLHSIVGRFGFDGELEIISNLDLMVSMDSGNAHLSSIFGVKTLTIWGITHPFAGFYPYGQDRENCLLADREKYPLIPTSVFGDKCQEKYLKAIETISVEDIVGKIYQMLGE